MKTFITILLFVSLAIVPSALAQSHESSAAGVNLPASSGGDYATDIDVVIDAEHQALDQARELLNGGGQETDHTTLQTAVKEMERAEAALQAAKKSPDKLAAAIAAEQSAYQTLLKAIPREYRMSRSRSRSQSGRSSGQPNQQEMDQLDLPKEENRYETESQATAAPTAQQREQSETLDRLKQLARRQEDLNERLRDLQNALQEARTNQEREDIQRQLKRLRDEERQMLADVDELRQKMEQSPDASRQSATRQQLEQTRNNVERAAQQLENKSVSEALASGARAEQNLQTARENMRQQTSSQFANQMRQMRSEARDLADKENQIGKDLDSLNNSDQKTLDDSAQRRSLVDQMNRQQSALTNLLGQMRNVTEQSENSEPLLSKQLYDVLRKADQSHTDNQLEIGAELVDRGFLPQASQQEHSAGKSIDELRQGVDRAADSVLGSETDALRYAQKELDDLASQIAREMTGSPNSTNAAATAAARGERNTNSLAMSGNRSANQHGNGLANTNETPGAASAENGQASQQQSGDEQSASQASQQSGNNGQNSQQTNQQGQNSQQPGGQEGNAQQAAENSQQGGQNGSNRSGRSQARNDQGQQQGNASETANDNPNRSGDQTGGASANGAASAAREREQLRQFAVQLGGERGGLGLNGPITGNNYIDWTERLRDVEQALDSPDLRNQLATVRERVGVYRRAYRELGQRPEQMDLQNKVLEPLALARDWVAQELSRAQNERSLVPLDRDPVQEKYSELVRKYYEKLGSPQ